MTNVTARIKLNGKNFEILVDVDKALQLKKGVPVGIENLLAMDKVFSDLKKGFAASDTDIIQAFGSKDLAVVADKIIKKGEILLPIEYRNKEREDKLKQIVDFLSRNAIDPLTKRPHTAERIKKALDDAGINIENKPISEQMPKIIEKLRPLLPIKIETKKILLKIPAQYTGSIYNLLKEYKEKEDWQNDGTLVCTINLPAGLQMEFYDKLNAITHGNALAEEIKQ